MLDDLVENIYETSNMDRATAEKVSMVMVQFLERVLPPDDFARASRYFQGERVYTPPTLRNNFPGYGGNQAPE
jgi:hypothetical protein